MEPLGQLVRGPPVERHRGDLCRWDPGRDEPGDPGDQGRGLAAAGGRHAQDRTRGSGRGRALVRRQPSESFLNRRWQFHGREDRPRPSSGPYACSPMRPPGPDNQAPGSVLLSGRWLLPAGPLVAVILLAMNLRGPFTSVGPVLPDIRADLGLSSAAAALLTGLPVLLLGVVAPLAPVLSRR